MMKGFMLIAMMTLSCFSLLKVVHRDHHYGNKQPRKLMEGQIGGNQYVEQLEQTNSSLNGMQAHAKRQAEMKQVGVWFSDIDGKLDDFRDATTRKLNELHMALQKPKVPMYHEFGGNVFQSAAPGSIQASGGGLNLPTMGSSLNSDRMRMRAL